jgi:hypothetical protein
LDEGERKKIREMFADFQGEDIMREKLMQLMEKEMLSRKRKAAEGWLSCPECGSYAPPRDFAPYANFEKEWKHASAHWRHKNYPRQGNYRYFQHEDPG